VTADRAVEVCGIGKMFGSHTALRDVTFGIDTGTVFGVIGPNGAGKTTLMRTLLDIIRPTAGHARVLGTDTRNAGPELRRRIGYLPGELVLQSRITGRRLLAYYADVSGPIRPGRIEELAARLNLDLDRPVRALSKGNRQKLGLVQAFMHEPDLLVLDEPTSGLDPLMQQEFLHLVREARNRGQTVFLSSHVISEIQQAADEVAILRDGRVVRLATVEELRDSAVRHLRIRASDVTVDTLSVLLEGLAGVRHVRCFAVPAGGTEATAILDGAAIQPFLLAISTLAVADLVLEEPDLEESVLGLYTIPEPLAGA
jgi:ABC-2 type transport system ATP-binding protein